MNVLRCILVGFGTSLAVMGLLGAVVWAVFAVNALVQRLTGDSDKAVAATIAFVLFLIFGTMFTVACWK